MPPLRPAAPSPAMRIERLASSHKSGSVFSVDHMPRRRLRSFRHARCWDEPWQADRTF